MKTKELAFTLSLALMLALLAAVPVSAGEPVIETGTYDNLWMPFDPSLCPGFVVWDHEVGTYRTTYYYDNEGNPLRVDTHYKGIDHLYNETNPDVVLSGKYSGTILYDVRTGELDASGLPLHITIPGHGTVLVRAGRWTPWPDVHAGKDSLGDPQDVEQFCSYLAGN
jgi:hypothetical protein